MDRTPESRDLDTEGTARQPTPGSDQTSLARMLLERCLAVASCVDDD
jgi:hypothetical protein